ncbi:MAG: hypothetical protein ACOYK9_00605 [Chlamydiia bacterium]
MAAVYRTPSIEQEPFKLESFDEDRTPTLEQEPFKLESFDEDWDGHVFHNFSNQGLHGVMVGFYDSCECNNELRDALRKKSFRAIMLLPSSHLNYYLTETRGRELTDRIFRKLFNKTLNKVELAPSPYELPIFFKVSLHKILADDSYQDPQNLHPEKITEDYKRHLDWLTHKEPTPYAERTPIPPIDEKLKEVWGSSVQFIVNNVFPTAQYIHSKQLRLR